MDYSTEYYLDNIEIITDEIRRALRSIEAASVEKLVEEILKAEQVFFIGVGRVMLAAQCIVKRLNHLGIKAHYVGEVTETAFTERDLLIVASGSGNSLVPVAIARKAKTIGAMVIHVGSNQEGKMKDIADFMIRIPVRTKLYLDDEIESVQPMTSLFEQSFLLLGDMIAKIIIEQNHLDMKKLWKYHATLE